MLQQQLADALARNEALAARAEEAEARLARQEAELAKLEGIKESRDRLLRRLQRAEEERKSLYGLGQDAVVDAGSPEEQSSPAAWRLPDEFESGDAVEGQGL